jgi:uncharacterized protein (DUF2147 family)
VNAAALADRRNTPLSIEAPHFPDFLRRADGTVTLAVDAAITIAADGSGRSARSMTQGETMGGAKSLDKACGSRPDAATRVLGSQVLLGIDLRPHPDRLSMLFALKTAASKSRASAHSSRRDALRAGALACVLTLAAAPLALAGDPSGTWLTQGGRAKVRVGDCGGALCGTIVWLRDANDPATGRARTDANNADASQRNRPLVGVQVVSGMHPAGAVDKWVGSVYSADRGKTYSGSMMLKTPTSLVVEGCVMALCNNETWTREVAADDARRSVQRAR